MLFLVSYFTLIFLNSFIAYYIINIFGFKFDTIALGNTYFLILISLPISWNVLFFINLWNVGWRIYTVRKFFKKSKPISATRLRMFMKIYNDLNALIPLLNRFYVYNLVLSIYDKLVISITTIFLVYDVIVHSLMDDNFVIILGASFYIFISGLICVLIIAFASFLNSMNEEIVNGLNGIKMKCNGNRKIMKFIEISILQVESTKHEISCGLFTFDWKLCFTFISSIHTYLIVMLQFDIMINSY